jgi:hypothetical protein
MYNLAGGEILVWAEDGGPIMLKVTTVHGDPIELAEHEAQELVRCLQQLLEESQARNT